MPMPQVTEQGDHVVHGVVRHTPVPSPAPSTLASLKPKFSSRSSSSSDLNEQMKCLVFRWGETQFDSKNILKPTCIHSPRPRTFLCSSIADYNRLIWLNFHCDIVWCGIVYPCHKSLNMVTIVCSPLQHIQLKKIKNENRKLQ